MNFSVEEPPVKAVAAVDGDTKRRLLWCDKVEEDEL